MIVLSAFLGGLALGNYYFGKRADNYNNPVKTYAWLELSIGVYCLLYPTLSELLGNLFISTASNLNVDSQNIIFIILRLLISAVLLFIPTVAMGGTLPTLSRFFVNKASIAQKEIGWLYFLNSFGAVLGVILAGFIIIKIYGLDATMYGAALVNIVLGTTAFLISKSKNIVNHNIEGKLEEIDRNDYESLSKKIVILSITTAGISGMAALLYEIVWVRLLVNFLGSSTYAFSIMLAAFISGITIGSFIVSKKFINKFDRIKLLIFYQVAIAAGIILSLIIYERLPYYFWEIASWFEKTDSTFNIFLSIEFLVCFWLMFIPTIFMGMTLPTVVDIVARSNKKIGLSVGKVFSINTVGTVVGVVVTTLVLIPVLGIRGTFEFGIGLNLLLAFVLLQNYGPIRFIYKTGIPITLIILFLLYIMFSPVWNSNIMNSGVFRSFSALPPESFSEFEILYSSKKILYYKEGINANVAVIQADSMGQKTLVINGKADATSKGDMPTQVMLGQVPLMLHENPKNVFVIGFGSGATLGSVLLHPVEKVTCVEISTEVLEASEFFRDVNNDCLDDPRLSVVHEDAHTYLKLSREKYDVIISEPSNPWIAGIGNLFSKEYFELCYNKLKKNGMMVQWFHVYEASDDVVQLVLNTFSSVFPYCQIWSGEANDLILVGSEQRITLNEEDFKSKFRNEKIKSNLELIGIGNPFTFLSTQILSAKGTFLLAREYPINTEKNPILEFIAPRSLFLQAQSNFIFTKDEKRDTLINGLLVKEFVKENIPSGEDVFNAAIYHRNVTHNYVFCYGLTKYLQAKSINNYGSDILSATTYKDLKIGDIRTTMLGELLSNYPDSAYVQQLYLNEQLSETTTASTFLKIFSMKEIAKKFIKASSGNLDALPYVYLQIAEGLLFNSEVISSLIVCRELEKWLKRNPQIVENFPMDRFYYTYASVLYHINYIDQYKMVYSKLLIEYPDSKESALLRRHTGWEERK